MTWDFYVVVGGSLFIAFLVAFLGWRQDRKEGKDADTTG